MTAYTLVHGAPTLQGLSGQALTDAAVLRMAERIELEDGLPDNPGHPQAALALLENGRVLRQASFQAEDLQVDGTLARKKFDDCLRHAAWPDRAEALWTTLMQGRVQAAFDMTFKES
jgi:hypothetical protein